LLASSEEKKMHRSHSQLKRKEAWGTDRPILLRERNQPHAQKKKKAVSLLWDHLEEEKKKNPESLQQNNKKI